MHRTWSICQGIELGNIQSKVCVCVCVCVCVFYGKVRTCYILGRSRGQGGEKPWEEQERVGSRILLEGLALLR